MIKSWDVKALPLKETSSRDYEHSGGYKRDYTGASLLRLEIWIIGVEEILDLPCDLFKI
jgi:hypothetical protein